MRAYILEDDLKKRLKNPAFRKAWEESELEYQLSRVLIQRRLDKKMSQRDLAKKAHTTQAVISRIEGMNSNPSIGLLKKLAGALGVKLKIGFE